MHRKERKGLVFAPERAARSARFTAGVAASIPTGGAAGGATRVAAAAASFRDPSLVSLEFGTHLLPAFGISDLLLGQPGAIPLHFIRGARQVVDPFLHILPRLRQSTNALLTRRVARFCSGAIGHARNARSRKAGPSSPNEQRIRNRLFAFCSGNAPPMMAVHVLYR